MKGKTKKHYNTKPMTVPAMLHLNDGSWLAIFVKIPKGKCLHCLMEQTVKDIPNAQGILYG